MSRRIEYEARTYVTTYTCAAYTTTKVTVGSGKTVQCFGEMQHDGTERTPTFREPDAARFRHRCTICGSYEWLHSTYPQIRYKRMIDETSEVGSSLPLAATDPSPEPDSPRTVTAERQSGTVVVVPAGTDDRPSAGSPKGRSKRDNGKTV